MEVIGYIALVIYIISVWIAGANSLHHCIENDKWKSKMPIKEKLLLSTAPLIPIFNTVLAFHYIKERKPI